VRGLSQQDICQTPTEQLGLENVSPSVVSRVSQKLAEDFRRWHRRSLAIHSVLYLFLDAFYLAVGPAGKRKTGLLVAYGITREGKKLLLDLTVGERESYEAWRVFLDDLKERGLKEPLLVVTDGNAGVIRAVRECLPSSLRQRCQVHEMRNVLAKLPRRVQGGIKGMLQRIFTADSYDNALRRGKELIARYQDSYPEAMAGLEKDLEECLTCLRFPAEHRKRIRTTNLLERLLGEGRRRTKVIPHFGQSAAV
jgi:putative transposase